MVPVLASTALSTKLTLPTSGGALPGAQGEPGSTASALRLPARAAASRAASSVSGTLKAMLMGSSWAMLTSGVAVAAGCTSVPGKTLTWPARPEMGARSSL